MDEETVRRIEGYQRRMLAAQHAMQSGVAYEMNAKGSAATDPKHLRVGINTAMVEHGGIVKLLVDKGIISEEEYFKAMAEAYEAEQHSYEERNGVHFG